MMKLKNYSMLFLLFFCVKSWAGTTPLFLYKYTENISLMPSLAGHNGGSIYLANQLSYVGFQNAPKQTLFGINMLKGKEHLGFGLNFLNQQGFGIDEIHISIPFAYYVPLSEKLRLSFGLSADYFNRQLTEQFIENQDDSEIPNAQGAFYDVSFSTSLHHRSFTVGAAFNHLNAWVNETQGMNGYFTTFVKANIPISNEYDRVEWANTLIYDLNGDMIWNTQAFYEVIENVIIGGGYSSNQSIISSLGVSYKNRWLIGYGFYYNVGTHASYFKNSHEVTLKFHLNKQYYEQHKYSKYSIQKGAMLKK